jgi:GNAT superfamily N-acetyltransferase
MTSLFTIRVATIADNEAVGAVLAASYTNLLSAHYEAEPLARALPHMTQPNPTLLSSGTYYIAESTSGDPAGCGGWTRGRPGSGEIVEREAHIRHVATHPAWAKRGVGAALMARCFAEAKAAGIGALHCFSTLNAVDFYRANGFDVIGPIEVRLTAEVTLPSVHLRRTL